MLLLLICNYSANIIFNTRSTLSLRLSKNFHELDINFRPVRMDFVQKTACKANEIPAQGNALGK